MNTPELKEKYGVSGDTIRRALREGGVETLRPNRRRRRRKKAPKCQNCKILLAEAPEGREVRNGRGPEIWCGWCIEEYAHEEVEEKEYA